MLRHPVVKLLALGYVAWGAWNWFVTRPVHDPDGVLAPDEPRQGEVVAPTPVRLGRWTVTPRASYAITARVLAAEHYHVDFLSTLIPLDLALGWGPMSDNRVLAAMDISQSNRFYYWHASTLPVSREAIIEHSANTHVIPENRLIARQLARLRRGQVVTLTGLLVDASRDDGTWIRTSLVRNDSGAGACEVLLVQDVSVSP